jgi:hypothetical protein
VRIVLFTGKGGVGKTTTAAATALRCADAGLRTIVLSTDPAHSLADAFGCELGDRPLEVAPRLFGQQLDTQARMEDTWVEIQAWLLEVFQWAGVAAIEAEELSVIPGLDEIFALSDIRTYAEERRVGRGGRRLRTHGRDAAAPQPPRDPALVHGSRLPREPAGQPGGVAAARSGHRTAAAGRRRVRLCCPLLRAPRRGSRAAHRLEPPPRCGWW